MASFVLALLWIFWMGSALAVIFGHIALYQINRASADAPSSGAWAAIVGLVLGWVGIGLFVLLFWIGSTIEA